MRRAAALVPVMSVLILAGVATAVAQRRGGFGGGVNYIIYGMTH